MSKRVQIVFLVFLAIFILALPTWAIFGLEYVEDSELGKEDIRVTVISIVNVVLGFLGILFLILFIYGGFVWFTAGGDEEKVAKAKKTLINAVIGLLVILLAYSITSFILNKISLATGYGDKAAQCEEDSDQDDDGYVDEACGGDDCDASDPFINPGIAETCDNGQDDDCDGDVDYDDSTCTCWDGDTDGYDAEICGGVDCEDSDPSINPGATEICDDLIDNDCDGLIDDMDEGCGVTAAAPIQYQLARIMDYNGHKTYFVNGEPSLVLGIFDPIGFSSYSSETSYYDLSHGVSPGDMIRYKTSGTTYPTGVEDFDAQDEDDWEIYYELAQEFGFNHILLNFPWKLFETGLDDSTGASEFDYTALDWHRQKAEKYGMHIIIRWFGSSVSDDNHVPFYFTKTDDPDFQADLADLSKSRVISGGAEVESGTYSWCPAYIASQEEGTDVLLEKEKTALETLMTWIDQNDPQYIYTMIHLNNEIGLLNEDSRDLSASCDSLFASVDPSDDLAEEAVMQDVNQYYIGELVDAVNQIIPGFITYLNVWPYKKGGPDPYDERADVDSTFEGYYMGQSTDAYVQDWLSEVPSLTMVTPDFYHIGFNNIDDVVDQAGTLEDGGDRLKVGPYGSSGSSGWQGFLAVNWQTGRVYPDWYMGGRNAVFRSESGNIMLQNEKPFRDIFRLIASPYNAIGDAIYSLSGSKVSGDFQGLVYTDDLSWNNDDLCGAVPCVECIPFCLGSPEQGFNKAFYTRNTFRALNSVAGKVAENQNTNNLVTLASTFDNDYNVSGTYNLDGTQVAVEDNFHSACGKGYYTASMEDKCHDAIPGRARGVIIKNGVAQDYTLVGVDYTATLDTSGWSSVNSARGYWQGDTWVSEYSTLASTVVEGVDTVSVTMSEDDTVNESWDSLAAIELPQYVVRVWEE